MEASDINVQISEEGRPVTASEDATAESTSMTGIQYPGEHDVMLGRGGESNKHIGNIKFRKFIETYKSIYQSATRSEKAEIALEVVYTWREMDPPGRFLAKTFPKNGGQCVWHDVGDEQARKKASKSLGERRSFDTSAADQLTNSSDCESQKRSRDSDDLDSETSKRQKSHDAVIQPVCMGGSKTPEATATISCTHPWMPDDWSDSGSSGNQSVEADDVCSDDISVTSQEPSFLPNVEWWPNVGGNAIAAAEQVEESSSPFRLQDILRDTNLPVIRLEEVPSGLPSLSTGAQDALKKAMSNIPTAAELAFDDIFQ